MGCASNSKGKLSISVSEFGESGDPESRPARISFCLE